MKAKFNLKRKTKGFNINHRKEKNFQEEYKVLIIEGNEIVEIINCRIYGTASTNYCCLWLFGGTNIHASGSAGGYGYHRPSAAAQEAIYNTGFELYTDEDKPTDINGMGDNSIQTALTAIAREMGYCQTHIIKSHP
jgi:hypothetical protein